MDLRVERNVVVELKALETLLPIHDAHLLTSMKPGGYRAGLWMNFDVPVLHLGIRRFIL